jgi:hypothetical protein
MSSGLFLTPAAAAGAQQPEKVRQIGILIGSSASFIAPYIETFRQALRASVDTQNRPVVDT